MSAHSSIPIPQLTALELEEILLTVDGRGREIKREALYELIHRATEGGRLDYDLMNELKRL
jgi:hypothetical protein